VLDATALRAALGTAQHDLFRLETLDRYDVPSDGGDFARYLAGEAAPDPARKAAWHDRLRADRERGVRRWRVHLVTEPLTPYLRFEIDWAHLQNAHLEDIRVLTTDHFQPGATVGETPLPSGVSATVGDFYLIDGAHPLLMHYDSAGRFTGAEFAPGSTAARYRVIRDAAWGAAEPVTEWWAAHPQYHRTVTV
jgi:hypothetical protein